MTSLNVFLVASLLIGHSICDAQVGKCVDERSGAVRYTDGPCPSQSKTLDISNDVVDHARIHYGRPRIEYRVGDGMRCQAVG